MNGYHLLTMIALCCSVKRGTSLKSFADPIGSDDHEPKQIEVVRLCTDGHDGDVFSVGLGSRAGYLSDAR
jgi:hypothetical protein